MRWFSWRTLLSVCAGLWSIGVAAQAAPEETAPPFPQLFRQAEQTAPRLRALDAEVEAAQGRARQARAWLNPVVGVEVEDVAGTAPYHGSDRAQTTVSVSEPLELFGQRGARKAAGQAALRSAEADRFAAKLDFAYELAVAYAQAEAAQARVTVLTEDLARAQEDVRSARALVNAGKEADLRAVQADAAWLRRRRNSMPGVRIRSALLHGYRALQARQADSDTLRLLCLPAEARQQIHQALVSHSTVLRFVPQSQSATLRRSASSSSASARYRRQQSRSVRASTTGTTRMPGYSESRCRCRSLISIAAKLQPRGPISPPQRRARRRRVSRCRLPLAAPPRSSKLLRAGVLPRIKRRPLREKPIASRESATRPGALRSSSC